MSKVNNDTLSNKYHGKFLMNVLVGDLLHVEVLMPAISGVDSVSTVTSLSGLGGTCTMTMTMTMIETHLRPLSARSSLLALVGLCS